MKSIRAKSEGPAKGCQLLEAEVKLEDSGGSASTLEADTNEWLICRRSATLLANPVVLSGAATSCSSTYADLTSTGGADHHHERGE